MKIFLSLLLCFTNLHGIYSQKPIQPTSLMIVAHPDDETIWGGQHLLKNEGKYVVVCITNGKNNVRKKEYEKVVRATGNTPVIYSFPDKINGKRSDWKECKNDIYRKLKKWIQKREWKQIVTHNPDGEYGHQHHKITSKIVTAIIKHDHLEHKLYYFGKYTKKKNMTKRQLRVKLTIEKKNLIRMYRSQSKVMDHLGHMLPFENWVSYNKWSESNENKNLGCG